MCFEKKVLVLESYTHSGFKVFIIYGVFMIYGGFILLPFEF
jgi:hypothetical protein